MKAEELYYKEFGEAESIPKESAIRLLKHFAIVKNELQSQLEKDSEIDYWRGFNDGFGSSVNYAPKMLEQLTQTKKDEKDN